MCAMTSKEDQIAMVESYLAGASGKQAGKLVGCSENTCYEYVRKYGYNVRSNRKHSVNESYFDVIDTEAKAYWLGFITADGCIRPGSRRAALQILLKSSDIDHLRKFKRDIQSDHPVAIRENKTSNNPYSFAVFCIYSLYLVNALEKLGVYSNKASIVKPCCHVPNDLLRHYWRGVFDGDGSICQDGGDNRWVINLTGNSFMVSGFDSFVKSYVKTKAKPRKRKGRKTTEVNYGGNALPKNIASLLYEGATVYLDRKHRRYKRLMRVPVIRKRRN